MKKNDVIIGCLCALGCEIIYGVSYFFTKQVTETISAFSLLGWRFLLAFLAMTLCVKLGFMKVDLKNKPIKPLLLVSLFSPFIYYIGEAIGISNTTASESGVVLACIPIASLIASAYLLNKKPTRIQIIGVLVTLVGAIITVVSLGISSSLSIIGYTFLMISLLSYALYTVYVDKASDYTGAEITYVMVLVGAIIFVPMAMIESIIHGTFNELIMLPIKESGFLIAILYLGIVCSVLAFFMSNVAIAKIGVNQTASFIGVSTVVSIFAGVLFLNEHFSSGQIMGAIIILSGVYIANSKIEFN